MFGKAKKEREKESNKPTPLDEKIVEAFNAIHEARHGLDERVVNVIRKNGVVALYPEGADKAKAIIDAEQAKHFMINSMAQYDEAMRELDAVLAREGERNITAEWFNHFCNSHEIVENVYYRHCMK